jgi:hypothetical protein
VSGAAGKVQFSEGNTFASDTLLHWDNTNNRLGVGTASPAVLLHVASGSSGASAHSYTKMIVESDDHAAISILTPNNRAGYIQFADPEADNVGRITYDHGGNNFIITTNEHDRMTIDSAGNVGIGDSSPDSKLHIRDGDIRIDGGTSGNSNKIIFKTTDNTDVSKYICTTAYWMEIGVHDNEGLRVKNSSGTNIFQISGSSGNVGIGDTTPTQKLDVAGNIAANSTGTYPVVIGVGLTTNAANIGVGSQTLTAVTSGDNVAIGYYALRNCTTAGWQVAIGNYALGSMTTQSGHPNYAQYSTAVGHEALWGNVNGSGGNVAIGFRAGKGATTGIQNTFIGMQSNQGASTGSNNICIGFNSATTGSTTSNEITLGNSSISNLRCQDTTISQVSDERDKTNIQDLDMGLEFICRLKPRRFEWNMRDGGKVGVEETGFVAQELQQAMVDEGKVIPGLVHDDNPDKLEAAPMALFTTLVKAIQELAEKVEALT